MVANRAWRPALAVCLAVALLGAAPAAQSYLAIEQAIERIQQEWKQAGTPPAHSAGWNAFFDAMGSELRTYSAASTEDERLHSLDRLYRMWWALGQISWRPAVAVREELATWLRPRVQLAWAERRLRDAVRGLPRVSNSAVQANRNRWIQFVDEQLGTALHEYESASTAVQHQAALKRVYKAMNALESVKNTRPWNPAIMLEQAMNDLFNHSNMDVTADVASLAPALNTNLVTDGWVYFKGQWSYVTAGPKAGFGLLPSDNGLAFYNSQYMSSVTNINGFNQQMEQDPRGRRATKLYHFDARSQDNSLMTITAVVGTDGLRVSPAYRHNADALIESQPTASGGFGRAVASLIGMNQAKITDKVYEGAIGQIRQGIAEGALELGTQRANEAAAERNQQIRQYLIGNDQLAYRNLLISGLSLRSRPQYAEIGGTVQWRGAQEQVGSDSPQPAQFHDIPAGVGIDVHLPSVMTNLTRGYLQSEAVQKVENLMVVTHKIPPDAPPSQGIETSTNVDFQTFAKAVATARAANDPKVIAIRIKRPGVSPEFTTDAKGHLVALVHDFAVEVPAPPQAARGGALTGPAANIYMLAAPEAEFVISFKIEPAHEQVPIHLAGRIEAFDPGPNAKVYAINEDESKAVPLTTFTSAIVLRVFGTKLQGQPVDVPLGAVNLRGYTLASASALDPSGWIRFVMAPTHERPTVDEKPPLPQPHPGRVANR